MYCLFVSTFFWGGGGWSQCLSLYSLAYYFININYLVFSKRDGESKTFWFSLNSYIIPHFLLTHSTPYLAPWNSLGFRFVKSSFELNWFYQIQNYYCQEWWKLLNQNSLNTTVTSQSNPSSYIIGFKKLNLSQLIIED